ncbi:MAG TPA: NAD(P)H-dependent oxidoreductase subunit E [Clostridia bacterium]|nr:NAD(P)H-dependent oxidoreductase subunit E [Clostridia bacterium]
MQPVQLTEFPHSPDHILHIFHEFQDRDSDNNFISSSSVRRIAEHLDLSMSQVYGVLSFYHMFSYRPRGKYVIRLCDSLSCRIVGSLDIYTYLRAELGLQRKKISDDGLFSLEIVNCLGSCHTAPNMMINEQLITNLTLEKVKATIHSLKEEAKDETE